MEDNEIIKTIIPVAEEYNFRFDKNTCHYIATGICPVDELKEEIIQNEVKDFPCKCVRLIQSIIHDGFIERNMEAQIVIYSNKETGKYEIGNGRHRICAASKMQVHIRVHMYD